MTEQYKKNHSNKKNHSTASGRQAADVSRRSLLGTAVSATSLALIPLATSRCSVTAPLAPQAFSDEVQLTLRAFVDRIIPADELGPGAVEAGAVNYINRSLAEWNSAERDRLESGLMALDACSRARFSEAFASLQPDRKDSLLMAMEAGQAEDIPDASALFNRLHRLTLEGTFSDPYYGGNRNYIGWDLIGYPGAVMASTPDMQRMGGRLPPLHVSAYGADYDGE